MIDSSTKNQKSWILYLNKDETQIILPGMYIQCNSSLTETKQLSVAKLSIATGHAMQIYNCPRTIIINLHSRPVAMLSFATDSCQPRNASLEFHSPTNMYLGTIIYL